MSRITARFSTLLMAVLPAVACAQEAGGTQQNPQQDPAAALRSGQYEDALRGYEALLADSSANAAVVMGYARALEAVGRYDDAEKHLEAHATVPGAELATARILFGTGRIQEAETLLEALDQPDRPDRLQARLWLGRVLMYRGQRDEALALFDTFIDEYNNAANLSGSELLAVGHAVAALGERDPDLFSDALRAFDEALAADATLDGAHLAIGDLFLDKHNSGEAKGAFQSLLSQNPNHPEANLGMARAQRFDGSRDAILSNQKALEVNPNLVPARVFQGLLQLELEDSDAAREGVRHALSVNPTSLEAKSILATADLLEGNQTAFQEAETEILASNPRYSDLYSTAAELLAQRRQYAMAAEMAAKGAELVADDARVRGHLAMNQLRGGHMTEGRSNLELAFEDDPHNVWYYNTLELLDDLQNFRTIEEGDFRLVLHEREADLLAPYLASYAQEALDALSARYGARPPTPIRLEVFPSHADFSVRTVGLAGLGALGVSFGSVLAMDSPSARDAGAFNWASTLWHEVAHSVHMGISDHRVPRWFTEGCAVYEQRRAREGWGDPVSPSFIAAVREEKLHPVSRLNEGFVRPSYPEHVIHSYYQASLVCEWIETNHGFDALTGFLEGYARGKSSDDLFREILGADPEDLDRDFDRHLKEMFADAIRYTVGGAPEEGPDGSSGTSAFGTQMRTGLAAVESGNLDAARDAFEEAARMFPQYGGQDGPHRHLARIAEQQGDADRAAVEWEMQLSLNENDQEAAKELARLLEESGESGASATALAKVIEIAPFDPALHRHLATLYESAGQYHQAVLERGAILALDPVDRAEALYELARAHWAAGQPQEARTRVLESLEIAPAYSEALDLLLEIRGEGT